MTRYGPKPKPAIERFRTKYLVDDSGCWLWTAAENGVGYGVFYFNGKQGYAHRFSYEHHVGPIPVGLDLDHLCRVRRCVNPEHLEPVTRRENLARGETIPAAHARKTHCPRGHEYTKKNTRVYRGSRHCRACTSERAMA